MNPIVLHFADGTTFFVGLALVLVAEILLFRFHARVICPVLTVLVIIGAILVAISATPLSLWMYSVWGIPALAGLVLGNRSGLSLRSRCVAFAVLLATTAGLCLAELPYHWTPHLVVKSDATVYVLGDSISAGIAIRPPPVICDVPRRRQRLRPVLGLAGVPVKSPRSHTETE